jgi:hypothetical protein
MPKSGLKSLFIREIRGFSRSDLPNSGSAKTALEGTPTAVVPRLKLLGLDNPGASVYRVRGVDERNMVGLRAQQHEKHDS